MDGYCADAAARSLLLLTPFRAAAIPVTAVLVAGLVAPTVLDCHAGTLT
jgi:hypothetical protein